MGQIQIEVRRKGAGHQIDDWACGVKIAPVSLVIARMGRERSLWACDLLKRKGGVWMKSARNRPVGFKSMRKRGLLLQISRSVICLWPSIMPLKRSRAAPVGFENTQDRGRSTSNKPVINAEATNRCVKWSATRRSLDVAILPLIQRNNRAA